MALVSKFPQTRRVDFTILCSFTNYLVIFLPISDRSELPDTMEFGGDSAHSKEQSGTCIWGAFSNVYKD